MERSTGLAHRSCRLNRRAHGPPQSLKSSFKSVVNWGADPENVGFTPGAACVPDDAVAKSVACWLGSQDSAAPHISSLDCSWVRTVEDAIYAHQQQAAPTLSRGQAA
eukprot:604281-Pyramimonas_sp.AAC.1